MEPAKVLLLSKPVVAPWDDSARNLARAQAVWGDKYRYQVLTTRDAPPPAPGVETAPVYTDRGGHGLSLGQKLRVMAWGLRPRGARLYHYFFAPNRLSALAGKVQRAMARVPTVQTVCSRPGSFAEVTRSLFTDRIVVLSRDTEQRLIEAGVAPARLRLIRPGIEPLSPPNSSRRAAIRRAAGLSPDRPLVIYPGDLEFSNAPQTVAQALPAIAGQVPQVQLVFACRIKRQPSAEIQRRIQADLLAAGLGEQVSFVNQVDDMPALIGAADLVLLPAESLYAKMDFPLVLLEAMAQKIPLVLAQVPPLDEILELGAGLGVPPQDPEALAARVGQLLGDPQQREALGQAGARAVSDRFSAQGMAKEVEQLYDELLAEAEQ